MCYWQNFHSYQPICCIAQKRRKKRLRLSRFRKKNILDLRQIVKGNFFYESRLSKKQEAKPKKTTNNKKTVLAPNGWGPKKSSQWVETFGFFFGTRPGGAETGLARMKKIFRQKIDLYSEPRNRNLFSAFGQIFVWGDHSCSSRSSRFNRIQLTGFSNERIS